MKKHLMVLVLLMVFVLSLTSMAFAGGKITDKTPPGQADKDKWKAGLTSKQLDELRGRAVKDRLKVNGKLLDYDVPPVIKEGRTLIPVRAITRGMGATIDWNEETKTITVTRNDVTVILTLGQTKLLVDGTEVEMDVPAQLISNRTFVPLRFIAQALGDRVNYDPDTGDIDINSCLDTPEIPTLAANIATWTAVPNENNGYSLRLFRNETAVTSVTVAHGAALSYDFSSVMTIAGSYTVKVKALATGDYTDSKESNPSQPQIVTVSVQVPAAPTSPVVDDTANTFGWTLVPDYTDIAQYEYSTDNGTTWHPCTANPQSVGNNSYEAGAVQIRVKADASSGRLAGNTLSSNAPFTVATTVTGSINGLGAATVSNPSQVTIGYTNNGTFTLVTYNVFSTTQILVNGQTAQFSDMQLGDAVIASLLDNALIKLEITR